MKLPGGSRLWIIIAVAVVILGLGLFSWQGVRLKEMRLFESALYQLLRPFQVLGSNIHHSVNEYWTLVTNLKKIKEENRTLRSRVAELELKLADFDIVHLENERLRKLLAFKELVPFQTIGAAVIGMTPNNWVQDMIINRGSADGIKENMPVITYNGALVGQISQVTPNTARLLLISDVNFVAGGRVQRPDSRAIGIMKGLAEFKDVVVMDQIPWDADVKEGDLVITSGLTETFPAGIPIGRVIRVRQENYGLIQQAEIKPFMNLVPIEEVLVITDF